jgi:hypothetical protein
MKLIARGPTSAFLFAACALATPAPAADADFSGLAGRWSGAGTVAADGRREHIRCKGYYAVSPDKHGLNQSLTCASDSYKFDIYSNVTMRDARISGQWTEKTRNIIGGVTGEAKGDQFETEVNAATFSATLTVTTRGDRQTVIIKPHDYNISNVSIALKRER